MTQGSILTLSSYATRTSPVLRGKWLLENLLGTALPPPPAEVPPLEEANLGTAASVRQRLEQHRANPACAACHDQMDPLGFSLENYDAAGRWRTRDGNFDVDSVGTLADGKTIAGAKGLKDILRSQSRRLHTKPDGEDADIRVGSGSRSHGYPGGGRNQPAGRRENVQVFEPGSRYRQKQPVPDAKGHGWSSA